LIWLERQTRLLIVNVSPTESSMPTKSKITTTAAVNGTKHTNGSQKRKPLAHDADGAGAPPTEWDRLSIVSRTEVERLVEVLKAVKQGDFTVRFAY